MVYKPTYNWGAPSCTEQSEYQATPVVEPPRAMSRWTSASVDFWAPSSWCLGFGVRNPCPASGQLHRTPNSQQHQGWCPGWISPHLKKWISYQVLRKDGEKKHSLRLYWSKKRLGIAQTVDGKVPGIPRFFAEVYPMCIPCHVFLAMCFFGSLYSKKSLSLPGVATRMGAPARTAGSCSLLGWPP